MHCGITATGSGKTEQLPGQKVHREEIWKVCHGKRLREMSLEK